MKEARAKDRPAESWRAGENAASPAGIRVMETSRPEVARRRGDRDFHAERIRERNFWTGVLLLVFLLGGAAAVFALMSMFNR